MSGPEDGPEAAPVHDPEVTFAGSGASGTSGVSDANTGARSKSGSWRADADSTGPVSVEVDSDAHATGNTGPVPTVAENSENADSATTAPHTVRPTPAPGTPPAPPRAAPPSGAHGAAAPSGPQAAPPPQPPRGPTPSGPGVPRPPVAPAQARPGPLRPRSGGLPREGERSAGASALTNAAPHSAADAPGNAAATASRPLRKGDRTAIAIVLHQFPIGHLPVAASEPSRQLPLDEGEGAEFPPSDHPRSELVNDTDALTRKTAGTALESVSSPSEGRREFPTELLDDHVPFGGLDELEWEREYVLAGSRREGARYAWSRSEESDAQPVVLEPDVMLDRLGDAWGRIVFPEGTGFGQRSQPAEFVDREYRRYRVLRPLPVWRTTAAAWFGQPGGAERYRTTQPIVDLESLGYVVELTPQREAAEAGTARLGASEAGISDRTAETAETGHTEDDRVDESDRANGAGAAEKAGTAEKDNSAETSAVETAGAPTGGTAGADENRVGDDSGSGTTASAQQVESAPAERAREVET